MSSYWSYLVPPATLLESFPPADFPRLTGKLLPEKRGDKFTNRFILQGLTKAREVEQGVSIKRVDHKNVYAFINFSPLKPKTPLPLSRLG